MEIMQAEVSQEAKSTVLKCEVDKLQQEALEFLALKDNVSRLQQCNDLNCRVIVNNILRRLTSYPRNCMANLD